MSALPPLLYFSAAVVAPPTSNPLVRARWSSLRLSVSPGSEDDSSDPMEAKAQQVPKEPWLRTAVSLPSVRRSYVEG